MQSVRTMPRASNFSLVRHGRTRHATCKACFEAKGSEGNRTGFGSCRDVLVAGGRRIRINRGTGSGHSVAGYRGASRAYSHRGGNLRRQPGDVLCLRQGNRRDTAARPAICPRLRQGLRRLPGLQRLRQRLWRLQRLRWLRLRWLRLLLAVGSLPRLLDSITFRCARISWRMLR